MMIGMTEELHDLEREIMKTRKHLSSLETRYQKISYGHTTAEEKRLTEIETEFRRRHPSLPVRRSLIALVGTEPYNPPSQDKTITRQIVAERYGR